MEPDPKLLPREGNPYRTSVTLPMIRRALRGWLYPYLGSRVKPGDFHTIISYLFTEWKCNLDCHYCWVYDNRVQGMTEDVARRSIDWLHDTGWRVLALMGGEVLLRPQFVHKVVDYAVQKGFWVYVPTNGRLMRPEVIDRLADAGVATFNLAVDSVGPAALLFHPQPQPRVLLQRIARDPVGAETGSAGIPRNHRQL